MKVAFWNSISQADDVINYMAAIGVILAQEYNCEVVLGSNYISNYMLQDCFFGKMKEDGIAHAPYRYTYGSSEYCRKLWSMKRNRQGNILEIPMEGLKIVYPPDITEMQMFYYNIPQTGFYFLAAAEDNKAIFQAVLEEADYLVVILSQNVAEIQKFFQRFSSFIPQTIFVIEEVQKSKRNGSRFSYREILEKHGIKGETVIGVSKSKEHKEACEEGKLETFLRKIKATKDPQYRFWAGIKRVAKAIYECNVQDNRGEVELYKKIQEN